MIDHLNPTVPVVVVPAPVAGTTNLIYNISMCNNDLGTRTLKLYLTNGAINVYLQEQSTPVGWTTTYRYPPENSERPFHQVAGWDLMMVTDGWSGGGTSWSAIADYAEDTGVGDTPSDYKWAYVATPAGIAFFDILAAPGTNKARIIRHISLHNNDLTTPAGDKTWFVGKNDGSKIHWHRITARLLPTKWESWLYTGMRLILEPGTKLIGYQTSINVTQTSYLGVSYLEVGGLSGPGYSDAGPWIRS